MFKAKILSKFPKRLYKFLKKIKITMIKIMKTKKKNLKF